MPQPSLSTYHPSLGERLQQGFAGLLAKAGVDPRYANHLGQRFFAAGNDLTPLGNVTMAADAGTAIRNGHPLQGLGMGALAVLPGAAGKVGKGMFGRAARELEVGYHLKDVKQYQPKSWRPFNQASDAGNWVEAEVPIRSLYGGQQLVNADYSTAARRASSVADGFSLPLVVRDGGEMYVRDGHHRLVAASRSGKQTAKVRLIDFDGVQPAPLLDLLRGY